VGSTGAADKEPSSFFLVEDPDWPESVKTALKPFVSTCTVLPMYLNRRDGEERGVAGSSEVVHDVERSAAA
jgi:hypothetical protein